MSDFSLKKMNGFAFVPLAALLSYGLVFSGFWAYGKLTPNENRGWGAGMVEVWVFLPCIFITALLYRFANRTWAIGFLALILVGYSAYQASEYFRTKKQVRASEKLERTTSKAV